MKKIIISLILLIIGESSFAYQLHPACKNKKITAYTKEKCIYCIKLKNVLKEAKLPFIEIEITDNIMLRNWLSSVTEIYTVPYVFLEDKYIGGYTDFIKKCIER